MASHTKKLFSLEKTAVKRHATDDAAAPSNNKVPKVSQMKITDTPAKTQRVATTAPVNMCVYKVTDASGLRVERRRTYPNKLNAAITT